MSLNVRAGTAMAHEGDWSRNRSETQLSCGEYGEEFPEMKVACSRNTG